MKLFPTVHSTGELPPAHRSHLEGHGLTFVGPQDDPDVVLVLPGTDPVAAGPGAGTVVLVTGSDGSAVVELLASSGISVGPTEQTGVLEATDLTADDLLAWTTDAVLPVRAALT